ncbi:NLRC3 [Symbiodinium sp. KB8]|nr:NLRC3 [Symbiodinium sp. KB8]
MNRISGLSTCAIPCVVLIVMLVIIFTGATAIAIDNPDLPGRQRSSLIGSEARAMALGWHSWRLWTSALPLLLLAVEAANPKKQGKLGGESLEGLLKPSDIPDSPHSKGFEPRSPSSGHRYRASEVPKAADDPRAAGPLLPVEFFPASKQLWGAYRSEQPTQSADAAAGVAASPEQARCFEEVEPEPSPRTARKVLKLTDEEILTLYRFAQAEAAHEADWRGLPQEPSAPGSRREVPGTLAMGADYLELLKKAMKELGYEGSETHPYVRPGVPIARGVVPEEAEEVLESTSCDDTEPCPHRFSFGRAHAALEHILEKVPAGDIQQVPRELQAFSSSFKLKLVSALSDQVIEQALTDASAAAGLQMYPSPQKKYLARWRADKEAVKTEFPENTRGVRMLVLGSNMGTYELRTLPLFLRIPIPPYAVHEEPVINLVAAEDTSSRAFPLDARMRAGLRGILESKSDKTEASGQDRFDLQDPDALARFLRGADVRLGRQRPLPRRQEADSETFTVGRETRSALVSHEEIRDWASGTRQAVICSISHAWETREHPDPCRYQLEQIVSHAALYEAAFDAEVWVFYDFVSLFQFRRAPDSEEERSFRQAMNNMHVLYAHECTLTFRIESLTPDDVWEATKKNEQEQVPVYDVESGGVQRKPLKALVENRNKYTDRGWCKAEVEWSSLRTLNSQHQRIDEISTRKTGPDSLGSKMFSGRIPTTPEEFRIEMVQAAFTHRSDAESVIRLQEKIFLEKVLACEALVLEGLPVSEMQALARALPTYKKLKHLTIKTYTCSEQEARSLSEALAQIDLETLAVVDGFRGDKEGARAMVKAIAAVLKRDLSIKSIDLSGNSLGDEGAEALAAALQVNKSVNSIRMSFGNIRLEGAKAVAAALERNTSVTSIDISAHNMGDEEAKVIAAALKTNQSIKHIDLSHNSIGLTGGEALAAALQVNTSITSMNMWMNPKAAGAVAAALERNKSVASIDVRQADMAAEGCNAHDFNGINCCYEHLSDQDVQALAEVLKVNRSTAFINLQQVQMSREGAKAVAAALQTNEFVRDVDLRYNQIHDEGVKALAEALKVNKSVAFINLQGVQMGPQGAKAVAVAAALQSNKVIKKIILCHNPIRDEGTEALAEALKVNESVTSIDFSAKITDDGARALAEVLRVNKSLVHMDMSQCAQDPYDSLSRINMMSNKMGSEGAKAFAALLKTNPSVTEINLACNHIDDEGAEALAEGLRDNTSVVIMSLCHNVIGSEGTKALKEAVEGRKKNHPASPPLEVKLQVVSVEPEAHLSSTGSQLIFHAVGEEHTDIVRHLPLVPSDRTPLSETLESLQETYELPDFDLVVLSGGSRDKQSDELQALMKTGLLHNGTVVSAHGPGSEHDATGRYLMGLGNRSFNNQVHELEDGSAAILSIYRPRSRDEL